MRMLAATLLLALVVGVAGTMTARAATVPQAVYVQRADAVCLDVARKALALQSEARRRVGAASGEAEVFAIFADVYRRQLTLVRSMRRRIVAIGTPRGAAATARALVSGIRQGEEALEHVIAAAERGSRTALTRAATRYREIALASARAVKRSSLGFKACGAGA